jgi:hypothetical protein
MVGCKHNGAPLSGCPTILKIGSPDRRQLPAVEARAHRVVDADQPTLPTSTADDFL